MNNPELLACNIYDVIFSDRFLVISKCLERLYPEIVSEFARKWKNVVTVCMEQDHFNKLQSKLFSILGVGETYKVGFLTPDGSPHCIQVHFAERYLKRGLKYAVKFEHYVVDDHGKVQLVASQKVEAAKLLAD